MKKITANELKKIYNKKDIVVIDVRDSGEFLVAAIPGSMNVPLGSFEDKVLEKLSAKNVIIYCQGGGRSEQAMEKISKKFGKDIYELEDGFNSWIEANGKIEKRVSVNFPVMQQVQITAGALVLFGSIMSLLTNVNWIGLSMFVGAGLMFAGFTGWCGMGKLLSSMPWNNR